MKPFVSLSYVSRVAPEFHEHQIPDLLKQIRPANARSQITGMLLYVGTAFVQVLEGEAAQVEALYARIERDKRHSGVTPMVRVALAEREFPEWTMDFVTVDPLEAGALVKDPGVFTQAALIRLKPTGVKQLIDSVRKPKWQQNRASARASQKAG